MTADPNLPMPDTSMAPPVPDISMVVPTPAASTIGPRSSWSQSSRAESVGLTSTQASDMISVS